MIYSSYVAIYVILASYSILPLIQNSPGQTTHVVNKANSTLGFLNGISCTVLVLTSVFTYTNSMASWLPLSHKMLLIKQAVFQYCKLPHTIKPVWV